MNAFLFPSENTCDGITQTSRMLWATVAALVLASCATTPKIASDYDRSANFATYHTFTLVQREYSRIPNPLVAIRAEEEIKQDLQLVGYTFVADPTNADFTVDFTIGSEERTDIAAYPAAYPGPWPLGGPSWGNNLDVRQYREGTLAIYVFDGHTYRPVWHGSAQKELTRRDLEQSAEPISKAVSSVLAKFPSAPGPVKASRTDRQSDRSRP